MEEHGETPLSLCVIARIHTDFPTKFAIPRQSGLANAQQGYIVFEPEYRDANAVRGLSAYSHIWLLWGFSGLKRGEGWSPMVKPPRLGGNKRMGVFATRSPNRPNPIGLSSVRLTRVEMREGLGPVLHVQGADLMDNTPIYDVKPYLSFTDSHPDAKNGFAGEHLFDTLAVELPEPWRSMIPEEKRAGLIESLEQDPRPAYRDDPDEPYGFAFAGLDVRFRVRGGVLTVFEVVKR